jgi:hypothetical protein
LDLDEVEISAELGAQPDKYHDDKCVLGGYNSADIPDGYHDYSVRDPSGKLEDRVSIALAT